MNKPVVRLMLPLAVLILLGGCLRLPVKGEFKEGQERFWGDATGYSLIFYPAFGPINIMSDQGASCEGGFKYRWFNAGGEGVFKCKDGRSGEFFFTSNGTEGKGVGRDSNGNLFYFQFGGPEYTARAQAQWEAMAKAFDSLAQRYRPTTSYCEQYGTAYRCTHYRY